MERQHNKKGPRLLKPGKGVLSRTLLLMAVCGIVAFVVLIGRLYQLMIVEHDEYEKMAVEQQTRETTVSAHRGSITDRNGNVLAVSARAYHVFLSPDEIREKHMDTDLIARGLSEILGVPEDAVLDSMAVTGSMYEVIARRVDTEVAEQVRRFISDHQLSGIYLEETSRRYYPYNSLACHVIGFVGTDGNGLSGIETEYDSYLAGTDGSVVRLTNAEGDDLLFTDYEYYYDAVDGSDLTLTLDVTAQYIAEKYLDQAISDYDVQKGGICIIMDVNTGAILAMAGRDKFDPNDAWTLEPDTQAELNEILGIVDTEDGEEGTTSVPATTLTPEELDARSRRLASYAAMTTEEREALYEEMYSEALYEQWRNRAATDTYEPGSVFKAVVLSMALDHGDVTVSSSFDCGGSMEVQGRGEDNPLYCWDTFGHGAQTLAEAVRNSCNVAFATIGLRIGARTFYEYVEAFGLFAPTGIDLPGEGSSVWWPNDVFFDDYNLSQLASASFGQTFNITPLQMITAYSATVNGGYLMQPYVVSTITDPEGDVVYEMKPVVVRQVISEETSETVREILESVVSEGTGGNAAVAGYRIGGKTGTSEKVAQDAAGGTKEYMVSFCGFAPADDPQVAVLLILDTPSDSTGIYISGGNMAAPTVGGIFSELLPYLGYEPVYTEEEAARLDVRVPNITGMPLEEARSALDNLGLDYEFRGVGGTVTAQLPAANHEVAAGSTILLYAEQEIDPELTEVPDLYGLSVEDAVLRLSWYDLFLDTTGASPASEDVAVSRQSVEEGRFVERGTIIEVTLTDPSNLGIY